MSVPTTPSSSVPADPTFDPTLVGATVYCADTGGGWAWQAGMASLTTYDLTTQRLARIVIRGTEAELRALDDRFHGNKFAAYEFTLTGEMENQRDIPNGLTYYATLDVKPIGETVAGRYLSHTSTGEFLHSKDPRNADAQSLRILGANGQVVDLIIPGRLADDLLRRQDFKEGTPISLSSVQDGVVWGSVSSEPEALYVKIEPKKIEPRDLMLMEMRTFTVTALNGPHYGEEIRFSPCDSLFKVLEELVMAAAKKSGPRDVTPEQRLLARDEFRRGRELMDPRDARGRQALVSADELIIKVDAAKYGYGHVTQETNSWSRATVEDAAVAHAGFLKIMEPAKAHGAHQRLSTRVGTRALPAPRKSEK